MRLDLNTLPSGRSGAFVRMPAAPAPEGMNNDLYLYLQGNRHHLAEHFGRRDTAIIIGATYISAAPSSS